MSGDPETTAETVVEGTNGRHDIVLVERHIAPSEGEEDPVKDFDAWRARRVMAVLQHAYPGHLWAVDHDLKQGVCKISIPILMGICAWWVFNLRTHGELTKGMVIAAGGEILERYGLSRVRFNLATFLEAREKHSALVNRHRSVPN